MKKIAIITASLGYDRKHDFPTPQLIYKDYLIEHINLTNENTSSRENSMHPRLNAKIPKMMGWQEFPGYDFYIWLDSTIVMWENFLGDIMQFEPDENVQLCLFKHPKRSSIRSELDYMLKRMSDNVNYLTNRYSGERIVEQVDKYLADELFKDRNLFSGGCFMYTKHLVDNKDYNLMTDWLLHNVLYSVQDQLSLPYLIQKHNIVYRVYPFVFGKILLNDEGSKAVKKD